jgi:hypothetical protein
VLAELNRAAALLFNCRPHLTSKTKHGGHRRAISADRAFMAAQRMR